MQIQIEQQNSSTQIIEIREIFFFEFQKFWFFTKQLLNPKVHPEEKPAEERQPIIKQLKQLTLVHFFC